MSQWAVWQMQSRGCDYDYTLEETPDPGKPRPHGRPGGEVECALPQRPLVSRGKVTRESEVVFVGAQSRRTCTKCRFWSWLRPQRAVCCGQDAEGVLVCSSVKQVLALLVGGRRWTAGLSDQLLGPKSIYRWVESRHVPATSPRPRTMARSHVYCWPQRST